MCSLPRSLPRAALLVALALAPVVPGAAAGKARKPAAAAKVRKPAAPAPTAWALSPETFKVERVVLDNGLVVLLHEDHSVPALTFWQRYRVGSRNEAPGITGISHFFEHMMFNGSKNVPPKEYDRRLESNGGFSNAYTDRDVTAYYEDVASDRLDVVLALDSDRMTALSLLPEQLESEIEVVKEERRLRTDNDIPGMLDEALWATAFVASPYQWPVVGWMGDLNRITRDDMTGYFRTYYAPDNCILVLCGDFDRPTALEQIRQAFGPIPRQAPPAPPVDSEPEQRGERRVEVHYPAQNVTFMVGYKEPGVQSRDIDALDVLSSILSDGESSRLHRALVYEKQIALSVDTDTQVHLNPGLFTFTVELKPGKTAAEGLAALDEVVHRLVEEGPTPRELEKAKNLIEAGFVKALKTNNGAGDQLGTYEHLFGDYRAMYGAVERHRAVTAADCMRVARSTFDPLKRTIAVLVPEKSAGAGTTP